MRAPFCLVAVLGLCCGACAGAEPRGQSEDTQAVKDGQQIPVIRTWEHQELRESEQHKIFAALIEMEAGRQRKERQLLGKLVEPETLSDGGFANWSLNKIAVQYHITEKGVGNIAARGFERGWPVRGSRSLIVRDDYQRIADRMSYIELVYLLGRPGEEVNRSNVAGIVTTAYKWSNSDGGNVNIIFQNGQLVSKAQSGLR